MEAPNKNKKNAREKKEYGHHMLLLPTDLDEDMARLQPLAFGAELTELPSDQARHPDALADDSDLGPYRSKEIKP